MTKTECLKEYLGISETGSLARISQYERIVLDRAGRYDLQISDAQFYAALTRHYRATLDDLIDLVGRERIRELITEDQNEIHS